MTPQRYNEIETREEVMASRDRVRSHLAEARNALIDREDAYNERIDRIWREYLAVASYIAHTDLIPRDQDRLRPKIEALRQAITDARWSD